MGAESYCCPFETLDSGETPSSGPYLPVRASCRDCVKLRKYEHEDFVFLTLIYSLPHRCKIFEPHSDTSLALGLQLHVGVIFSGLCNSK
jgi:hypothetical protein